ncbi:hypothetical protein AUTU_30720 [Aureibacter tunicatorum]|nr:hypothetical protein AUTU_30720 [Aureibacter tunicatorum]
MMLSIHHAYSRNEDGEEIPTEVKARSKWLPDQAKLQYAGGTGMFSIYGGYTLGKRRQHELELGYGYRPKDIRGANDIHIVTARYLYSPIKVIDLGKNWSLSPLKTGIYFIYFFDRDLNTLNEYHPKDYYALWGDKTFQFSIGQSIHKSFKGKNTFFQGVSFYYDFNQDLTQTLSTFRSFKQPFHHLIMLGFGVGLHFE